MIPRDLFGLVAILLTILAIVSALVGRPAPFTLSLALGGIVAAVLSLARP